MTAGIVGKMNKEGTSRCRSQIDVKVLKDVEKWKVSTTEIQDVECPSYLRSLGSILVLRWMLSEIPSQRAL
jgi:hypothetical protein